MCHQQHHQLTKLQTTLELGLWAPADNVEHCLLYATWMLSIIAKQASHFTAESTIAFVSLEVTSDVTAMLDCGVIHNETNWPPKSLTGNVYGVMTMQIKQVRITANT